MIKSKEIMLKKKNKLKLNKRSSIRRKKLKPLKTNKKT